MRTVRRNIDDDAPQYTSPVCVAQSSAHNDRSGHGHVCVLYTTQDIKLLAFCPLLLGFFLESFHGRVAVFFFVSMATLLLMMMMYSIA